MSRRATANPAAPASLPARLRLDARLYGQVLADACARAGVPPEDYLRDDEQHDRLAHWSLGQWVGGWWRGVADALGLEVGALYLAAVAELRLVAQPRAAERRTPPYRDLA